MLRKIAFIAAIAFIPNTYAGEAPPDIQTEFSAAVALLQQNKAAEALPLLRDVAAKAPDRPGAFWNLGLAATAVGDKQLALQTWLHYRELMPGDAQGFGKVIQSYQALGMTRERDAERTQVFAYQAALPTAERDKFPLYVRDQFDAAGLHFVVLEYFEPAGVHRQLYRFNAVDAAQKISYYFAIENDERTSSLARQLGEIGKDESIYSLDRYDPQSHATFGLMKALPPYEAVRAMVVDAAEGRSRPVSSSSH